MMNRQLEREEQALEDDLSAGMITLHEFNREMRELRRDYTEAAHEAARDAYDREMERW